METLEFEGVLWYLKGLCSSELGKQLVEALWPSCSKEAVERMLEETWQMKLYLEERGELPARGFPDVGPLLEKAQRGALLGPEELKAISESIRASLSIKEGLSKVGQRLWLLAEISRRLNAPVEVMDEIDKAISPYGEVRDDASPLLLRLRRALLEAKKRAQEALKRWLDQAQRNGLVNSDVVTERNGRFVVLLRSDAKGRAKGIIHGTSGSGASFYFEPLEVLEFNNELNLLVEKVKEEEERILRSLSFLVKEKAEELKEDLKVQAELDFLYAKAKLALRLKAVKPVFSENEVRLRGARHPLLELQGKRVVPVDLVLEPARRVLVLSGANAGGKTVALKTLGLLVLMAQSGMLIPVGEDSTLPLFEKVFVHIGDEQNLSQDLSTFSSFVLWAKEALPQVDSKSLVLIDELGSGTDQTQGAALSMAILDYIKEKKGYALVTTHVDALKAYAFLKEGVRNASVEFDLVNMSPTYKILYDVAGKSWAFPIAQRWGMPEAVLEKAYLYAEELESQQEKVLRELFELKERYERELKEALQIKEEALVFKERYRGLWEELKQKRRELLRKVQERGLRMIGELEQELRELSKRAKDSAKAFPTKGELTKLKEKVKGLLPTSTPKTRATFEVRVGDWVEVKPLGAKGQVERVEGEEVEVLVGGFKVKVEKGDLSPLEESPKALLPAGTTADFRGLGIPEVNVRGLRVEEALKKVDKLIDEALIKGWEQVEIVHGIGTGALRKAIREYLRGIPYVKSVKPAPRERGGEGVTVVELG